AALLPRPSLLAPQPTRPVRRFALSLRQPACPSGNNQTSAGRPPTARRGIRVTSPGTPRRPHGGCRPRRRGGRRRSWRGWRKKTIVPSPSAKAYGAADRVPRVGEEEMKDFKRLKLGVIEPAAGWGALTLRATRVPGKQVMEVWSVEL